MIGHGEIYHPRPESFSLLDMSGGANYSHSLIEMFRLLLP